MPPTVHAALVIVLFVMPGFIVGRISALIVPENSSSDSRLLLNAITMSCLNYGLLGWLLAVAWVKQWYTNAFYVAGLAALSLFVVPALLGILIPSIMISERFRKIRSLLHFVHPIPRAWDYYFSQGKQTFILATLKDGSAIAGWYGLNSFASSFPHEPDLYLERTCYLDEQRNFIAFVPDSNGVIINVGEVRTLEFIDPPRRIYE